MNFSRSAMMLAALLISSQASAGLHSFSFSGVLGSDQFSNMIDVYQDGTPFSGVFQLDDSVAGVDSPTLREYYGAYSGYVVIGNNKIQFADSLAHVQNPTYADMTSVTLLGGPGWNTGGSISETQAPAGYAIEGFQIRFDFLGAKAIDTPMHRILADNTADWSSVSFGYGYANNFFYGNWGEITDFHKDVTSVPEPQTAFLLGLGLIGLIAARKRRR